MSDATGRGMAGVRRLPVDDAAREEQHAVLASLLGAYADGELPEETVAQIDAHLLGCARCRREVRLQQAFGSALAATMGDEPGGAVPGSLLARVRTITAAPPARREDAAAMPGVSGGADARLTPAVPAPAFTSGQVAAVAPAATRAASPAVVWRVAVATAAAACVIWALWSWRGATSDAARGASRAAPAGAAAQTRSGDAAPGTPRATVAPQRAPSVLELFVGDFRAVAGAELPGRARDLDAVRRAVRVPVVPLASDAVSLVAAWTTDLDGELAAVLAYRWGERLVLQYVSSDALLFRSAAVRDAFGSGRTAVFQRDSVGVIAWSAPHGGTVLVGVADWSALQTLRPSAP